jgi:hypothetical protein
MSCGRKESGSQNETGVDNSISVLGIGEVAAVEDAVVDSDGDDFCCCL